MNEVTMNEFKKWFEQGIHSSGLTRLELIKQMNYKNTDKGLRRLSEFLENPHKSHNEFIELLCSKLKLDLKEVHQKVVERQNQTTAEHKPYCSGQ